MSVLRVLLLGDEGVGKSSILARYMQSMGHKGWVYEQNRPITYGATIATHQFEHVSQDQKQRLDVCLNIFDSGGRRNSESTAQSYHHGSVFVFVVDSSESLSHRQAWILDIINRTEGIDIVFALSKNDLSAKITLDDLKKWIQESTTLENPDIFRCSALKNKGIENLFKHIETIVINKAELAQHQARIQRHHILSTRYGAWWQKHLAKNMRNPAPGDVKEKTAIDFLTDYTCGYNPFLHVWHAGRHHRSHVKRKLLNYKKKPGYTFDHLIDKLEQHDLKLTGSLKRRLDYINNMLDEDFQREIQRGNRQRPRDQELQLIRR